MKVELRVFKHVEFLLLLPETAEERFALDMIKANKFHAEKKTDDYFMPYISINLGAK